MLELWRRLSRSSFLLAGQGNLGEKSAGKKTAGKNQDLTVCENFFLLCLHLLDHRAMNLKYQTLNSSIHISFWQELSVRKLETLRLSTEPVPIVGRVQNASDPRLPSTIEISSESFPPLPTTTTTENKLADSTTFSHQYSIPGKLHIVNTLEDYKTRDKRQMLNDAALNIWNTIQNKDLSNPSDLCEFFILVHADLKKHKFLYWFCFPALAMEGIAPVLCLNTPEESLPPAPSTTRPPTPPPSNNITQVINTALKAIEQNNANIHSFYPVCVLQKEDITSLSDYMIRVNDSQPHITSPPPAFIYFDSCPLATSPGWTLRNLLTALALEPALARDITVHCLRLSNTRHRPYSVQTFHLRLPTTTGVMKRLALDPSLTGSNTIISGVGTSWETDRKQRPRPRLADLSSSMDPRNLARVSVDLNVKLMRWRMLPELNTVLLQQTKCLLLGAGTLGCNVGRCLMGWGIRNITFVDNGKVSYSNPVRQSLFRFEDCANGGKPKAQAAADELKRIFPDVNSQGIQLNIHMPGHTVDIKNKATVRQE